MTSPTVAGLDVAALHRWLAERELTSGPPTDIRPLTGGTQNLMYRMRCAPTAEPPREVVLRRGPLHLRERTNDALRREIRVLTALTPTPVRAPRLIAAEPDESLLGSVFYLMEVVDGVNVSEVAAPIHLADAGVRHAMGLRVVDALAELGAVDVEAVGLADIGRPAGFLDRQVPQWRKALTGYADLPGYPGHALPHIDALSAWLNTHQPTHTKPGLMHGDFHMANLMFRTDGAEVAAIVDWEMCTYGDPLLDLGWFLITWPVDAAPLSTGGPLDGLGGLATRQELIERYAAVADRRVDDVLWYTVLAAFKLAIVLEGTHARAAAGLAPVETGAFLHASAVRLLTRAAEFIEQGP